MITADQLKDVMDRADALHHYLNIDQKKVEFEEEQLRTQAPDFWEDPKYAQEQMKKVKGIQKWLDGYKTVRLYADAANAKTKMENGFDLTNYDERTLAFAKDYANQLLAIDVNLNTTEMLDVTWGLFSKYFKPEEVNIKKEFVDQYWKK